MKKYINEKTSIGIIVFGLIILIIGFISFLIFQSLHIKSESFNIESFSQFGGFIGGIVGSFWSLAGFILFYIALKKQKKDLKISRKALESQIESMNLQTQEFKAQVQELEETRKVYIEQNKTQVLQRFENTFFNILSLHHKIVEGIDLDYKDFLSSNNIYDDFIINYNSDLRLSTGEYKSRDVFKKTSEHLFYLIQVDYEKQINGIVKNKFSSPKDHKIFEQLGFKIEKITLNEIEFESYFNSIYYFIYNKVSTDFGHYFRNLYRMIKMIDEQVFYLESDENDFDKKYYYTSIVRSQLSDYELLWLFFNCVYIFGEKFKPLVEKYAFFKIFDGKQNDVIEHYKKFYKITAFGID
jgi:hypothetical protein